MATLDKELLQNLNILYVEDDINIQSELSELLSKFFKTVHTASNGKEGLKLYKNNSTLIDIIIADINMPVLSGIDMLKAIRTFDSEVPVVFATAYSDNEFLNEAIKLKVYDYIVKPIDIRSLMESLTLLAKSLHTEHLIKTQNKELIKYKDIIYNNNMVITVDNNMNITSINELFKNTTAFSSEDLVSKPLISLKHQDVDENIYKKISHCILNNKQWKGKLKSITKDNSYYIADTHVISLLNDTGQVTGALVIQKDETSELWKKREVQNALIKDKGEIFIKGKENSAELLQTINSLNTKISDLTSSLSKAKDEAKKYIYTAEKYTVENKRLKNELKQLQKHIDMVETKHAQVKKVSKENSDLHQEIRALNANLEHIKSDYEKQIKQIKVNYEVTIDDIEAELEKCNKKLEASQNVETISQKLEYWKEKAKSEARRIDEIERKVINHGDKTMMDKLFGRK